MKLSVYVVTLNEEKRLAKTLKAASEVADEIIVVDSGSIDKTQAIANMYGAKFIYHKWESYCAQKSFAEKQCQNDWVLLLDADEVLSESLIQEINQIKTQETDIHAYRVKICNMFPEDDKPRRFAQTFNTIRMYNRQFAHMPADLHNKDRIQVRHGIKIGQFTNVIHHYCFLDIEQAVAKYNRHSTELVKAAIAENRSFSKVRLFTEFPRQFLRYYIFKKYCLLGTRGFMQAMVLANFRYLKIAKWFEWKAVNKKKPD